MVGELLDGGGDVVANQSHPVDAVDAALGGFIGVPVLEPGTRNRVDMGLQAQRHNEIDLAHQGRVDQLRVFGGDVDTDLE